MFPKPQDSIWQFVGHSVRGASHLRDGKPNQDAIAWRVGENAPGEEESEGTAGVLEGLPLIVAIADGHGSERYVHSDRGSRFAVEVAVEVLTAFVANYPEASAAQKAAQNDLPKTIVRRWKERVSEDIAAAPGKLADGDEPVPASAPVITADSYIPYGATLLAVAVAPAYILYLQLGDGDIVTVAADGNVALPMKRDENLIANETYSLCQPKAQDYFRFGFQAVAEGKPGPSFIMLSTDGYANSYETEADFHAAARDYWEMSGKHGLERVREKLPDWLNETSKEGSGDDITLGLIKRFGEHEPIVVERRVGAVAQQVGGLQQELARLAGDLHAAEQKRDSLASQLRVFQWAFGVAALLLMSLTGFAAYDRMEYLNHHKALKQDYSALQKNIQGAVTTLEDMVNKSLANSAKPGFTEPGTPENTEGTGRGTAQIPPPATGTTQAKTNSHAPREAKPPRSDPARPVAPPAAKP